MSNIPILFINATTRRGDFQVVVFTKNEDPAAPPYFVAWRVIAVQSGSDSVEFIYPEDTSVGFYYKAEDGGQIVQSALLPAAPGSKWSITPLDESGTPVINPQSGTTGDNTITVLQNTHRLVNIGLYKSGQLLVVQPDVQLGEQASFLLQPKLYFGITRNVQQGEIFTSPEAIESPELFNLSQFQGGLQVTLTEDHGKYTFIGKSLA